MIERIITKQQNDEMLIYHELSHYLLCEISRRIEKNFTKPIKIVLTINGGQKAQIEKACSPNNFPEDFWREETNYSCEFLFDLEKAFFLEDTTRVFLKTLQIACGYLSSTIFLFNENVEYFINDKNIKWEAYGQRYINFYTIEEELEKEEIAHDFKLIKKYWELYLNEQLNEERWKIFVKYTKNVLENKEINTILKGSKDFCLNLNENIIEGKNLEKLEEYANNLLTEDIFEFYRENLRNFIKEINLI